MDNQNPNRDKNVGGGQQQSGNQPGGTQSERNKDWDQNQNKPGAPQQGGKNPSQGNPGGDRGGSPGPGQGQKNPGQGGQNR